MAHPTWRYLMMSTALSSGGGGGGGGGATAYRYYRMFLLTNSLYEAELALAEFRTTVGSSASDVLAGATSIAWTGTVFAGAVANITDGSPSTYLAYARSNRYQYLNIDLGSAQAVEEVWFKMGPTTSRGPGGFMLVGSNDNITFEPLFGRIYISHSQVSGAEFTTTRPDFSTARNWGIMAITGADASWLHIHEAQFRGSIGGADLTGSGAGVASSAFGSGFGGVEAFDNNTATRWAQTKTTSGGQTITHPSVVYDFGSAQTIVELSMTTDAAYAIPTRHITDFFIFSSDGDFTSWGSLSGATPTTGYVVDLHRYVTGGAAFAQGETRDYAF